MISATSAAAMKKSLEFLMKNTPHISEVHTKRLPITVRPRGQRVGQRLAALDGAEHVVDHFAEFGARAQLGDDGQGAVQRHSADGVHASFSSHQLNGALSDLCVRVYGIHGCADTHYGGVIRILGKNPWTGAEKDDTFRGGAIQNVKDFIASIRESKPIYNYEVSVESNLTAILGRTAAYRRSWPPTT